MKKIATHDSGTGESSLWFTVPLIPFARTLSKNIKEQYWAGCRLFDIRIKKVLGKWRLAHGWWFSKCSVQDVLEWLNNREDLVYLTITYEGRGKKNKEIIQLVKKWKKSYSKLSFGSVYVKYGKNAKGLNVKYDNILPAKSNWIDAPTVSEFKALNGSTWHTYLPIPWLWKKIYYNKPKFNEDCYIYVDFL